jgi:hypothetical protein
MDSMTSANETKAVLDFLLAQSALTAITANRIWADVDEPPEGYKPAEGVGICFRVRGGADHDPDVIVDPSFQFKLYGATEAIARQGARVLHDNFDGKANKDILTVRRETLPVPLKEPDADWAYALVFYRVMVRSLESG